MNTEKITIKNVDMEEGMKEFTIEVCKGALEKYTIEKDIASSIKRSFDKKFGANWHCVVGKSFGCYVTHGKL